MNFLTMHRKDKTPRNHTAGPSPGKILGISTSEPPSDFYQDIGITVIKRTDSIETAGVSKIRPELTPAALYFSIVQKR